MMLYLLTYLLPLENAVIMTTDKQRPERSLVTPWQQLAIRNLLTLRIINS